MSNTHKRAEIHIEAKLPEPEAPTKEAVQHSIQAEPRLDSPQLRAIMSRVLLRFAQRGRTLRQTQRQP